MCTLVFSVYGFQSAGGVCSQHYLQPALPAASATCSQHCLQPAGFTTSSARSQHLAAAHPAASTSYQACSQQNALSLRIIAYMCWSNQRSLWLVVVQMYYSFIHSFDRGQP